MKNALYALIGLLIGAAGMFGYGFYRNHTAAPKPPPKPLPCPPHPKPPASRPFKPLPETGQSQPHSKGDGWVTTSNPIGRITTRTIQTFPSFPPPAAHRLTAKTTVR